MLSVYFDRLEAVRKHKVSGVSQSSRLPAFQWTDPIYDNVPPLGEHRFFLIKVDFNPSFLADLVSNMKMLSLPGTETCEPHFAYTDILHMKGKVGQYGVLGAMAMLDTITEDTFDAAPLYVDGLRERSARLQIEQEDIWKTVYQMAEAREAREARGSDGLR